MVFTPCFGESETHKLFGQALIGYLFCARQASAGRSRDLGLALRSSLPWGESNLRVWHMDALMPQVFIGGRQEFGTMKK